MSANAFHSNIDFYLVGFITLPELTHKNCLNSLSQSPMNIPEVLNFSYQLNILAKYAFTLGDSFDLTLLIPYSQKLLFQYLNLTDISFRLSYFYRWLSAVVMS